MNSDNDFGFAQLFEQPLFVAAEMLHFLSRRIDPRLGAAGPGREALCDAGTAFLTPMGEVGRVETFSPKQSSDGASAAGGISRGQDLPFVGGRVSTPFGAWSYFRVGRRFGAGRGGRGA